MRDRSLTRGDLDISEILIAGREVLQPREIAVVGQDDAPPPPQDRANLVVIGDTSNLSLEFSFPVTEDDPCPCGPDLRHEFVTADRAGAGSRQGLARLWLVSALRQAHVPRRAEDLAEAFGDMTRFLVTQTQQEGRQLTGLQADHGMPFLVEPDIDGG